MQKTKNLTLWIDGLLDAQRVMEASDALKSQSLPALHKLLSKADYHFHKPLSFEAMASYLFHQRETLPSAPTRATALCNAQAQSYWVSIDPVQMVPDRDTLVLIPATDIGISEFESKELLMSFNEHFAQDGLCLEYGAKDQWFLAIKQPVAIQTTPLSEVLYQGLNGKYPEGAAGNYWRQLMNETQMLFYNHPVNQQRRMQNLPDINSVWVWGEGQVLSTSITQRPQAAVFSNHAYLQGMGHLTLAACDAMPNTFAHFASREKAKNSVHSLVQLDLQTFTGRELSQMTLEEWLQTLARLEADWFMPLLDALQKGEWQSVLLVLGANKHYHLKPSHLKRFWRLNKRWSALVN